MLFHLLNRFLNDRIFYEQALAQGWMRTRIVFPWEWGGKQQACQPQLI
jgi:hypothetical protein